MPPSELGSSSPSWVVRCRRAGQSPPGASRGGPATSRRVRNYLVCVCVHARTRAHGTLGRPTCLLAGSAAAGRERGCRGGGRRCLWEGGPAGEEALSGGWGVPAGEEAGAVCKCTSLKVGALPGLMQAGPARRAQLPAPLCRAPRSCAGMAADAGFLELV